MVLSPRRCRACVIPTWVRSTSPGSPADSTAVLPRRTGHRVLSHCRTLRARKVLLRDQEVRVVKQLLRDAGRRLLGRHPAPRRPRPGGGPARARRSCRV